MDIDTFLNSRIRNNILGLLIFIEAIMLLINSYNFYLDYQDTWILSGLEVYYFLFLGTFILYCYFEDRLDVLFIFTLVARFTLILIPNLKYFFFLGRSIDQHNQYNLANFII